MKAAELRFGTQRIRTQDLDPHFLEMRRLINQTNFSQISLHPYHQEIIAWKHRQEIVLPLPVPTLENFVWIDSEDQLRETAKILSREFIIAVDTESHTVDSYLGFICLIQIATYEFNFIIDVLKLYKSIYELLGPVFENPSIVKLFCDTGDVRELQRDFAFYSQAVINLQEVYAQVYPSKNKAGLKEMAEVLLHVQVDKSGQLADWRKRPLHPDLLKYAGNDSKLVLQCWYELLQRNKIKDFSFEGSKKETLALYCPPKTPQTYLLWLESLRQLRSDVSVIFRITDQFELFDKICCWKVKTCKELDTSLRRFLSPFDMGFITRAKPVTDEGLISIIPKATYWENKMRKELIQVIKDHIDPPKIEIIPVVLQSRSNPTSEVDECQDEFWEIVEEVRNEQPQVGTSKYGDKNCTIIRVGKNRRTFVKRKCRQKNHRARNTKRVERGMCPLPFRKKNRSSVKRF